MNGQSITRFIQVTGAANIGWTEAGLIAGNDYHNGGNACTAYSSVVRHPVRAGRFYVPTWVEEDRRQKMVADAARAHENPAPIDVFDLEWDLEQYP